MSGPLHRSTAATVVMVLLLAASIRLVAAIDGSLDATVAGGDCSSRPPAGLAACCAEKAKKGEKDPSCPATPGADCASRPPADLASCCAEKAKKGEKDPSCPPLNYAILLSEGPEKPGMGASAVPWGSYHITITGYLPCHTQYPRTNNCTQAARATTCGNLSQKILAAAETAWKVANGGSEDYRLRNTTGPELAAGGKEYRAIVYDKEEQHTGHVLGILADELCKAGFGDIKGPAHANEKWHISLGTADPAIAKTRFAEHAAVGKALCLWLVPCRTNSTCSSAPEGCPCGNYQPNGSLKPPQEQWVKVLPK